MSAPVTEAVPSVTEGSESKKKERSPAQMEALARARVKAVEMRKLLAEVRRDPPAPPRTEAPAPAPEAETVDEPPPPVDEAEPEEEIQYVKKSKATPKKPKKRIVVVEESSESDEEIEVRLPAKRKAARAPVPRDEPSAEDLRYQRTWRELFSIR